MREFALSLGLKRLFSFAAIVAVSCALLFLSGCGHKCHCNQSGCNTCNTCSTCGVSDASTPGCASCQAAAAANSSYDRVGVAPSTLSDPGQPNYSSAPPPYASGSAYSGTNASLDRVGDNRELPIFSAPAPATSAAQPSYSQPAPVAAALIPQDQPVHGGGQYHVMAQGETIYALSRKYGVKPRAILDANHFSDPNHLSVGTKVYIPNN